MIVGKPLIVDAMMPVKVDDSGKSVGEALAQVRPITIMNQNPHSMTVRVSEVSAVRFLSLDAIQNMTGKQLSDTLKLNKKLVTIKRNIGQQIDLGPTGVYIYDIMGTDEVPLDIFRENMQRGPIQSLLDGGYGAAGSGMSANCKQVLTSMHYPVYGMWKSEDQGCFIAVKVPHHEEIFNSPSYGVQDFKYRMPDLLFLIRINESFCVTHARVYVIVEDSMAMENVVLGALTFPNVFNAGNICMGHTSLENASTITSIGEAVLKFVSLFLHSNWKNDLRPNNSLMPPNLGVMLTKLRKTYPDYAVTLCAEGSPFFQLLTVLGFAVEHPELLQELRWKVPKRGGHILEHIRDCTQLSAVYVQSELEWTNEDMR